MSRLTWLLAGLDGQEPWGEDAADVISLQAAARIQPERLVARIRELSASHAPLDLVGLDIRGQTARARIRDHAGTVTVVACTVEADSPHRVTSVIVSGLVPDYLVPRLPMDFTGYPLARAAGDGTRLVVFSGVPGTGKSTLSDAVGRRLGIPVFAVDWLLGSLTPFGGYHMDAAWDMGPEMLTTLAVRQLALGQSAILDFPTEDQANRTRWRTLAHQAGADFKVILCVCSDQQV
ncbi:MAG TPA: AAA family ATPase, partial [Streptosporangiaceae bacterium]|nr:AAA family ATPase [Streptosporangiaceae bacterium]